MKNVLFFGLIFVSNLLRAQSGDEILAKHIDAIGGGKAWNDISSIIMTGSISVQGMEIGMEQTIVNGKGMRTDIHVLGMNGYTIITPTDGWIYLPFQPGMEKVTPIPAEELRGQQDKINLRRVLLADKDAVANCEYLGQDSVNNVNCYKIKVTDRSGGVQTAFIDAANYYLVRTENKVSFNGEDQEVGINYSNFKKFPEGVTMAMVWGSPQGDITFKTVEFNKVVDEKVFKPAAEDKK